MAEIPPIASTGFRISALPTGESGWVYYALCAGFFLLCGLCCGYFIWKRGHLQMLDAESEVAKTAGELQALREDLRMEERELRGDEESSEIDEIVSSARK